jgi:hypothetical protein
MAHFARVENNTVGEVIVISNDDCNNLEFPESEPVGQAYIASIGLDGEWLQTSYSGAFRNIFAGQSIKFDSNVGKYGAFVVPPIEQ